MPVMFIHIILDLLQKLQNNFYKARFRTNIGKTTFSALAVNHWQKLPQDLKELSISNFPRKAKQYLLPKQI